MNQVDLLVVGGGPAGLTCAREVARAGYQVVLAEREAVAGGVPRHTDHLGFGLRDQRRMLRGPAYADRLVGQAQQSGVQIWTNATVIDWTEQRMATIATVDGTRQLEARSIVVATGCRERPRHARLIPGDRPAGVLTTGSLQHLAMAGLAIGHRAVVIGGEHVSFSAVLTLRQHHVGVVAMVTDQHRHGSLPGARLILGRTPLITGRRVSRIVGGSRLAALELDDGRTLQCDTAVFTGDWVGEITVARRAGMQWDPARQALSADERGVTTQPGVFAAGNVVHPARAADACALGGRRTAVAVLAALKS